MIQSQGKGVTESGLRVRTWVTVLLSALRGETVTPDHMTQSLQQKRAGRGEAGVKKMDLSKCTGRESEPTVQRRTFMK